MKYEVTIKGQTIPYILKFFDTKKEAEEFIKILEEQDRTVLCCFNEYCIREIEVR